MSKLKPWLELKNIDAYVQNTKIFSNLNLSLYYNENVIILGPNGAGKTTLVKLIDKTIYPVIKNNSYLRFFDQKNISLWEVRSQIGFVSKEISNRIPHNASGIEVISSGFLGRNSLRNSHPIDKVQNQIVHEIMQMLSIVHLGVACYGSLSDGEKRILIIARALINNPQILVLDEPLINLDIRSRFQILNILGKLYHQNTTIIQVTHDLDNISKKITRVLLLKGGKIIKDGSPNQCLKSDILSKVYETPIEVISTKDFYKVLPLQSYSD